MFCFVFLFFGGGGVVVMEDLTFKLFFTEATQNDHNAAGNLSTIPKTNLQLFANIWAISLKVKKQKWLGMLQSQTGWIPPWELACDQRQPEIQEMTAAAQHISKAPDAAKSKNSTM